MVNAERKRRWDLVVGAAAATVAVAGLLLSINLGNTQAAVVRFVDLETQKALVLFAAVVLILVGLKAAIRYRGAASRACPMSLERLLRRWPGRGSRPD